MENTANAAGTGRATSGVVDGFAEPDGYALRHYLSVIWRRKLIVIGTAAVCLANGLAFASTQETTWVSSAEVLAQVTSPNSALAAVGASGPGGAGRSQTSTEVAVMGSEALKRTVEAMVGHDLNVSVELVDPDSDVARITIEGDDKATVQSDALAYADAYVQLRRDQLAKIMATATEQVQGEVATVDTQIKSIAEPIAHLDDALDGTYDPVVRNGLENQREDLIRQWEVLVRRRDSLLEKLDRLRLVSTVNPTYGVQVLSGDASQPQAVDAPGKQGIVAAAAGLGLLLGLTVAFASEHFDNRVRTKRSFESITGLPVIGLLPRLRELRSGAIVAAESRRSTRAVEAFRKLRTSIQLGGGAEGIKRLLVVSPNARDGRTTTVVNLAVAFAAAGRRVIVVDGNLRRPRLHRVFGVHNDIGLTTVLSGVTSISAAVQRPVAHPDLRVLTSGPPVADPASLLAAPGTEAVLSQLAEGADYVLFDGPPLLPVTDALLLSRMVDGVVVVARAGRTKEPDLATALELLSHAGAAVVGGVLNRVDRNVAGLAPYGDRRYRVQAAQVPAGIDAQQDRTEPATQLLATTAFGVSDPTLTGDSQSGWSEGWR